jgi:hypothetical protein
MNSERLAVGGHASKTLRVALRIGLIGQMGLICAPSYRPRTVNAERQTPNVALPCCLEDRFQFGRCQLDRVRFHAAGFGRFAGDLGDRFFWNIKRRKRRHF